MGNRNTAWGNRAYKEVIKNGGSKEEAKQASKNESEKFWQNRRDFIEKMSKK